MSTATGQMADLVSRNGSVGTLAVTETRCRYDNP